MLKHSLRRRTPVCPVPKPRRRNVPQSEVLGLSSVGVSGLPGQVLRRILRESHCLRVLVVGATGAGKSSLVRTLLRSDTTSCRRETESMSGFLREGSEKENWKIYSYFKIYQRM